MAARSWAKVRQMPLPLANVAVLTRSLDPAVRTPVAWPSPLPHAVNPNAVALAVASAARPESARAERPDEDRDDHGDGDDPALATVGGRRSWGGREWPGAIRDRGPPLGLSLLQHLGDQHRPVRPLAPGRPDHRCRRSKCGGARPGAADALVLVPIVVVV